MQSSRACVERWDVTSGASLPGPFGDGVRVLAVLEAVGTPRILGIVVSAGVALLGASVSGSFATTVIALTAPDDFDAWSPRSCGGCVGAVPESCLTRPPAKTPGGLTRSGAVGSLSRPWCVEQVDVLREASSSGSFTSGSSALAALEALDLENSAVPSSSSRGRARELRSRSALASSFTLASIWPIVVRVTEELRSGPKMQVEGLNMHQAPVRC